MNVKNNCDVIFRGRKDSSSNEVNEVDLTVCYCFIFTLRQKVTYVI